MEKLKVLIPVDHAVGISGPHRNVVGTLNALGRRSDIDVVLLTSIIDPSEPYARSPNLDIRLGFHPHDPKKLAANLWRIRAAARGCGVIYVPTGLKALLYAQTVKLGRKLVAGPNVTPLPIGKSRDAPGRLELEHMSDVWIEASNARRDHVRRVTGNLTVRTLHHAIDTDRFSPSHRADSVRQKLRLRESQVLVLHVGRDNEPRKGVSQLLDAMNHLNAVGRTDIRLVMAGRLSDESLQRISRLDNVATVGFLKGPALSALYASADMSIVPSSWENFPFTVMESLASGLAVIAAPVGGIPEMIIDGETGVLVDIVAGGRHRDDAGERLAEAILHLADDREYREHLGRNARQRVMTRFSEECLGEDLVQRFQEVLGKGGKGAFG